jgi:HK97 family phage portal protein
VSSLFGKIGRSLNNKTPVAFATKTNAGFSGLLSSNSTETYLRQFGTTGTVHAIVSLLAQSVSSVGWCLYRKQPRDGRVRYTTGDGGADQRIEVVQHAALSLLKKPNKFYTQQEFLEAGQQHMELAGEQFWILQRAGDLTFPTEMWIARPDRMQAVPDPDNFISGWFYHGPAGEKVPLELNEVIQTKYPNPLDPYRGIGPVGTVLNGIESLKYSAEWNRNFFINGAEPGGIIKAPGKLTDDEFNELRDRWAEGHKGVSRAHRVGILEGTEWIERGSSMKDMQFVELRNVSRDELREAWRIHKANLGMSDDVNRANAEAAGEFFDRQQVIPRLNRIRMTLNEKLLPMFGSAGVGVEFDYDNPVPEDREADSAELIAKANAAKTLIDAGFDPDDVLETVGLPQMGMAGGEMQEPAPAETEEIIPAEQNPIEEMDMSFLQELWNESKVKLNGHAMKGVK